MRNRNHEITSMETSTQLKNDTNDEHVYATLYKQIIGSLRYQCNIIPDIFQSGGLVSRFIEKPKEFNLLKDKINL